MLIGQMNEIKMCPSDLNIGLSTNLFSVFRLILNFEKGIIKQNIYFLLGKYLFHFS